MCPLATAIGTVHIKFEDVNICIWYSCVLIINTQYNSSVACGLAQKRLLWMKPYNSLLGLCEIVVILINYIFIIPI